MGIGRRSVAWGGVGVKRWGEELVDEVWAAMRSPVVDPDLYRRALSALLQDDRFGSVIFGIIQTDPKTCQLKFPAIIAAVTQLKPKKPVIFATMVLQLQLPIDTSRRRRLYNCRPSLKGQ